MGSKGMQHSRDGGARRHLPKVGTRDEVARSQRLERKAIADTMGISRAPAWVRWVALLVIALVVVGGVIALVAID